MEAKDDAPMSPSAQAKVESGRRDIMEKVMQFAMSENFEKDFEDFALEHKKEFLKILVMDLNDTHPMEWHETYLEYLHTFEGKIERFIKSAGFEVNDFYEECKVILETDDEDELSIPIPIDRYQCETINSVRISVFVSLLPSCKSLDSSLGIIYCLFYFFKNSNSPMKF